MRRFDAFGLQLFRKFCLRNLSFLTRVRLWSVRQVFIHFGGRIVGDKFNHFILLWILLGLLLLDKLIQLDRLSTWLYIKFRLRWNLAFTTLITIVEVFWAYDLISFFRWVNIYWNGFVIIHFAFWQNVAERRRLLLTFKFFLSVFQAQLPPHIWTVLKLYVFLGNILENGRNLFQIVVIPVKVSAVISADLGDRREIEHVQHRILERVHQRRASLVLHAHRLACMLPTTS